MMVTHRLTVQAGLKDISAGGRSVNLRAERRMPLKRHPHEERQQARWMEPDQRPVKDDYDGANEYSDPKAAPHSHLTDTRRILQRL